MQSAFSVSFRRLGATSLPISARFCFSDIMNRCTKSSPSSNSTVSFRRVTETPSSENCSSYGERNEQGKYFESARHMNSDDYDCKPASDHKTRRDYFSNTTSIGWSNKRRRRLDLGPEIRTSDFSTIPDESLCIKSVLSNEETSLPTQFGKKRISTDKKSKSAKSFPTHSATEALPKIKPFDICLPQCRNSGNIRSSFCESYDEEQNILESGGKILQPGLVLLKHYITHNCQVNIVNTCRELGLGPGGFYRPGYYGGGKLHLNMMCLGLNWDPNTRKYEDERKIDACKPPDIPYEFNKLVKKAIQHAHTLIREDSQVSNAQDMLPAMSPNICIVNFYTETGRLGLHQDRDESKESLEEGLPVVSLSIGDSAEFIYGNVRDVNKAKKIVLESGDVLIFGGKSRHIYHGISSIIPNSTPNSLLQQTGIRPGRLNLTFRQF